MQKGRLFPGTISLLHPSTLPLLSPPGRTDTSTRQPSFPPLSKASPRHPPDPAPEQTISAGKRPRSSHHFSLRSSVLTFLPFGNHLKSSPSYFQIPLQWFHGKQPGRKRILPESVYHDFFLRQIACLKLMPVAAGLVRDDLKLHTAFATRAAPQNYPGFRPYGYLSISPPGPPNCLTAGRPS